MRRTVLRSTVTRVVHPSRMALSTPAAPAKRRLVSGIQPTGSLHIGNYLGAIQQWVGLQDSYDPFFFVVDLHALTSDYNTAELRNNTIKAVALYLASGIDPKKSKIFVQSHVPAHSELTWLLSCITPQGWLQRMTQYKDKAQKKENISEAPLGLFSYPVLMAADILLYQAEVVPVGEDQLQHLELARAITKRFNHKFCGQTITNVFRPPKGLVVEYGARVMSLTDGTSKMSKSAENDYSRINMLDTPDVIATKIKKCKTDSHGSLSFGDIDRPECNNLLSMYQAVTKKSMMEVSRDVEGLNWGSFKPLLTEAILEHVIPIQKNYKKIMDDQAYIDGVLKDGCSSANATAESTLKNAKTAMGFLL